MIIALTHGEIVSIVSPNRENVTHRLNAVRREGTIDFIAKKLVMRLNHWPSRQLRPGSGDDE